MCIRDSAEAPTRDDRPSGSSGGGLPPVSGGGSGYYPPASSGGGGMSGIPGGMRGAAGGGGVLLALCAIIAYMLFGGGEGGQDPFGTGSDVVGPSQSQEEFDLNDLDNTSQQDSSGLPQLGSTATSSASFQGSGSGLSGTTGAAASSLPAASGSSVTDGQTWTIMLYQDADDKVPVSYTHLDVYKRQVFSTNTPSSARAKESIIPPVMMPSSSVRG